MSSAIAGDICAVAKLSRAETGDTLSAKDEPLLMEPWLMPDPLLPVAIVRAVQGRRGQARRWASARLVAEDPTMRLEQNPTPTSWCCGAWARRTSTCCSTGCAPATASTSTSVPLRVRCARPSPGSRPGHGRHVKQSGGHGQYAVCDIEVEPLPSGGGFEFVDKVVGGAVPRQFIPSVEKGVRAQAERGVAAGYPVVDVKVTLVDGKAHSVDSSDAAFQTAGALALREAAGDDRPPARAGRRAVACWSPTSTSARS